MRGKAPDIASPHVAQKSCRTIRIGTPEVPGVPIRMRSERCGNYELKTDGLTVWVNNLVCVARFGGTGYEVNNGMMIFAKRGSGVEGATTESDWEGFIRDVNQCLDVQIPEGYKPARFTLVVVSALPAEAEDSHAAVSVPTLPASSG